MNCKLDTFRRNHLLFFHFLSKVAAKSEDGTATFAKLSGGNGDNGGRCHGNEHLGEHLGELGFRPLQREFATFHMELLNSAEQKDFISSNLPTEVKVYEKNFSVTQRNLLQIRL